MNGAGDEQAFEEGELTGAELLVALARLDAEAAAAYSAAAEIIDLADIQARLREFEADHLRHLASLKKTLESLGEQEAAAALGEPATLLAPLARMSVPLGPHAALMTLLNNEQLTNVAYENALAYEWDAEAERMLERHRADEERHFEWLSAKHDELADEEEGRPSARS